MSKILRVLALTAVTCWPTAVLAASAADTPTRGMSKAEVRAQFGEPERTRPAVGQPPISRWDYNGFSVYFEHDTTVHSVLDGDRAPVRKSTPATDTRGEQSGAHSTAEADAGRSPANGEEPPTGTEEQETQIEVETYNHPSDQTQNEVEDEEESSIESDSAPGGTGVRADNGAGDHGQADNGRFRFDPTTGRIVVEDDDADDSGKDKVEEDHGGAEAEQPESPDAGLR